MPRSKIAHPADAAPDQYIVVYGNIVDGFEFEGPFATEQEALDHGQDNSPDYEIWTVAVLQTPRETGPSL